MATQSLRSELDSCGVDGTKTGANALLFADEAVARRGLAFVLTLECVLFRFESELSLMVRDLGGFLSIRVPIRILANNPVG
jgi:hypothetical protein